LKREFVDYKKWNIENSIRLQYSIIEMTDNKITVSCNKCKAIKTYDIKSLYSNYKNKTKTTLHSENCSQYFNNLIRKELGDKKLRQFRDFYRYARERSCNPNNKDYERYKGKMKFEDYVDYFLSCYEIYKINLQQYGMDAKLTIDRIDGNKGYEHGNIRFVPMEVNLQNKEIVIPVMAVNINTKEILTAVSLHKLCSEYFINSHSAIYDSIQNNTLFKNKWKIFYTLKTQSTIETISNN
jgi:hypothetical protein